MPGGLFDRLGVMNPRLYLPTALGGHTPAQMREAHHADLYTAGQHADAMISHMAPLMVAGYSGKMKALPPAVDVEMDHARATIGVAAPLAHSRHHKLPADRIRDAWDAGTLQERREGLKSSMVALIEGGDRVRTAVPGATSKTAQLSAMALVDPKRIYEWHPDNITIGREPRLRMPADPGNAPDPASLAPLAPLAPHTPRSARMMVVPPAPTAADVHTYYEGIRTSAVVPVANRLGPTRFTNPAHTTTHS